MSQHFDAIVLGLGGMGSSALDHLTRAGLKCLGIEQYPLVHQRGSSHGHTRIIRTAYYEHPDYVPLVRRAFENWHALEQRTGRHLLTQCDCLTLGPADGELVQGVRSSAREHHLQVNELSREQLREIAPVFAIPEGFAILREQNSGYLFVEECVRAHLDSARERGATIHSEEPVFRWQSRDTSVEVHTGKAVYHAASLVITAGAWATQLLQNFGLPLSVMRQTLLWFEPNDPSRFRRDRFPIFIADTPGGAFYGLPMIDRRGLKVARHYGAPELPTPDSINWDVTENDALAVRSFLDEFFPNQIGRWSEGQACMYTLSPDRHFVIDRHPEHANVAVAAGFSGHGFKFASVVGEVLADFILKQKTQLPIQRFRATRFLEKK